MKIFKILIQIFLFVTPWLLRRILLNFLFGYEIHKNARIGFSLVLPDNLIMEDGAMITSFTFVNNVDNCHLKEHSKIGNLNWITGTNTANRRIFQFSPNRLCELVLGCH